MSKPTYKKTRNCALVVGLTVVFSAASSAQEQPPAGTQSSNFYGMPGLIETPSALPQPSGQMGGTVSSFAGTTRFQYMAQIHPRIAGSFRYTQIEDFNAAGFQTYFDRSFDLRFTVLQESAAVPAVTVGLQDFIGTGIYGAEYVVATKTLSPRLAMSAGLGWGRLSSGETGFTGFGDRPELTPEKIAEGGEPNLDALFRGDVGVFGGVEWRLTDAITAKVEYSSDAYDLEAEELGIFDRAKPYNVGLEYAGGAGSRFGAYYLYGSEIGLTYSFSFNPDVLPTGGNLDSGPVPVLPRPAITSVPEAYGTTWSESDAQIADVRQAIASALVEQRLVMEALELQPNTATLYLRNTGYIAQAQAIGRAVRVLSRHLPSSVETLRIVPVRNGMTLPGFAFQRTDIETLDVAPDGTERALDVADVIAAAPTPAATERPADLYPGLYWRLSPYLSTSFFDPDNPVRADLGIEGAVDIEVGPGTVLSGGVRKKVVGNLDESTRDSDSQLPRVRSDFVRYDAEGDPYVSVLTAAHFHKLPGDFYGRLTAGYLERMFGGVSSELLWAPYDSRIALGAELNYARQRAFDGGLEFLDYDVVTGHASLYYSFDDDFFVQVDAGRYLAGDDGATFTVERVFANGWRVGAFATFTNVSAEEFGEGSFDKGIRLSVPIGWFDGKSSTSTESLTVRPLLRDGGARLQVRDRLYRQVRSSQRHRVEEQWGRFWR